MYDFDDYRTQVLRYYERRKAEDEQFSLRLVYPTAVNLKEEAISICKMRYKRSDEQVLASFFDPQPNIAEYILAISKSDATCFKPICNFIKQKTTRPEEKQVEMLAWLIDFEHRPHQEFVKKKQQQGEAVEKNKITGSPDPGDPKKIDEPGSEELEKTRLIVSRELLFVGLFLSLFVLCGGYVFFHLIIKPTCMRWTGQRYEIVSCEVYAGDPSVIPYDPVKLRDFRMITRYDTLTVYSLNKVWYVKRNGEAEFYTAGGVHPVNPDLKLKRLTDYLLNTVVRRKREQLLASSGSHP